VETDSAEVMFCHVAAEAIGQTLDLVVPEPYGVAHWAGFLVPSSRVAFATTTFC
jgi:hypothetical protein